MKTRGEHSRRVETILRIARKIQEVTPTICTGVRTGVTPYDGLKHLENAGELAEGERLRSNVLWAEIGPATAAKALTVRI